MAVESVLQVTAVEIGVGISFPPPEARDHAVTRAATARISRF